jgi:hypothetical protein
MQDSTKRSKRHVWLFLLVCLAVGIVVFRNELRRVAGRILRPLLQEHSVRSRMRQFEADVYKRLAPDFARADVAYPPVAIGLVGLKDEKVLQLYAAGVDRKFRFIRPYPIVAASGTLGPKLREGDGQVPEGVYRIESLNPNSMFHLALRVNYPNAFDRAKAVADGRNKPGDDIMIHGRNVSVGCLAMGDPAIEELFVLAALAGVSNIDVVISPVDFRTRQLPPSSANQPEWCAALYDQIRLALASYPPP